jgi:hypothetical protein
MGAMDAEARVSTMRREAGKWLRKKAKAGVRAFRSG